MSNQNLMERLLQGVAVEWKALGEVAVIQRGSSPRPIANYVTDDEKGIPWIKIGDTTPASKYVENTAQKITAAGAKHSRILKKGDFIMSNSMSFGRPYILNIDGAIHDGWASISDFGTKLNSDYLYHYLSSNSVQNYWISKINSGSVSNLNADIIKSLPVPIPPLEIQSEIVPILDTFTELTAELKARKKQYTYYRDQLLTFKEGQVEWKALGDLCVIGDGLHGTPKYDDSGEYFFINGNNLDNGSIVFNDKTKKVDDSMFKKHGISFTVENTIFLSINGTIGSVSFYNNEKIVLGKSVAFFKIKSPELFSKYLFYFLQTDYSINYFETQKTGSTIKNLGLKALRAFEIPIPPLAEQTRIVAILDKFDALTNSITEGLPREIELRQKQYEYYREMLLSFPGPEVGDSATTDKHG